MKSTDELVSGIRRDTRNQDAPDSTTSTIGIEDSDIVRYINYGQERLQSIILQTCPVAFQKQYQFNTVAGTEEYSIPKRVYMGERTRNVRMSFDGQARNFRDLPEKAIHYRNQSPSYYPSFYIRRSGSILVCPVPTSANPVVQVIYDEQLDDLALRNGTVSSASGSSIVLSSPTTTQEAFFAANTYICVSKFDGTVVLQNGLISSYDAGTDTITLSASVSSYLVTGYSLSDLTGAYVTIGKWTTTHSKLPDNCGRYLELYAAFKLFKRDSSQSSKEAGEELSAVEKEILKSFEDVQQDEAFVQVINPSLVISGDWDLWR